MSFPIESVNYLKVLFEAEFFFSLEAFKKEVIFRNVKLPKYVYTHAFISE